MLAQPVRTFNILLACAQKMLICHAARGSDSIIFRRLQLRIHPPCHASACLCYRLHCTFCLVLALTIHDLLREGPKAGLADWHAAAKCSAVVPAHHTLAPRARSCIFEFTPSECREIPMLLLHVSSASSAWSRRYEMVSSGCGPVYMAPCRAASSRNSKACACGSACSPCSLSHATRYGLAVLAGHACTGMLDHPVCKRLVSLIGCTSEARCTYP